MKKIGLISDTHGWVHPHIHQAFADMDFIVHAGDIGKPEVLEELEQIAPVKAVKGNIDGGELRFLPLELVEEVEGLRLGVLHIAGNPKNPNRDARSFITREKLDVIVVGHSHIPVVARFSETLWINPGAAGKSGFHLERFAAILEVDSGEVSGMSRVLLGARGEKA